MLSIHLFGQPRFLFDGRPLDVPRRKSRALVYYLAAHRNPLSREHLLAVFWPELDRSAAQSSLRTTLHELRKVLGDFLAVDKEMLALADNIEMDIRVFEDRLSPPPSDIEQIEATLKLYAGDLLDSFALTDSPEFDTWMMAERERYRRLAVRGLIALAEQHEKQGHLAKALEALNRALDFDPLQEDLQRECMRLHYLSGDRAGAIRRYESLRKLLSKEMGVPPMAETRALYDAIISDTLPASGTQRAFADRSTQSGRVKGSPQTQLPALPFTGRASELQVLQAMSKDQTRKLALIEGEPGIGKTRLAEEFIRGSDALCLIGVARELEQALPYQPIIHGLRGLLSHPDWRTIEPSLRANLLPVWRTEIARLLPELALAPSPSQRPTRAADEWRLWEAISQFLAVIAQQQPIIVFLDDLHWSDASTLGMLGYLVRQTASAPIFFLGATRPVVPRSTLAGLLQTLTREGRLTRLNLSRLSSNEITAIARHLSPKYAPALADWLARASEGNPYILDEVVRHARESGILLKDGIVNLNALSTTQALPQTVYSLIQTRLERLSEEARRVLDAAVAVGREFEFEVVAQAAALSENAALDALDELSAAGLVRPLDGERYAFDHSLTMEVAYREISEVRHRSFHRRVAEAIESIHHDHLEDVAGLLAWHFAEGNTPKRGGPYAFQAGNQASRLGAWTEAIAFYQQAISASGDRDRLPILKALGQAQNKAGHYVQASETFRDAAACAKTWNDDKGLNEALLALGQSLLAQARYQEIVALAQQVRDKGHADNAMSAEFLWGAALSLEGADLAEAASHLRAAEALYIANAPGRAATLAQIKFEQGGVAAQQGDITRAVALYREALAVAEQSEDEDEAVMYRVLAHNNLGYHLLLSNDPSALNYAIAGLQLAREKGMLGVETYLLSTLGEIALAADDLETAEKYFVEGLAVAERLSIPERIAGLTANLGLVAQRRGETSLAVHRLSTALAQADALGTKHLAAQIRLWLIPLLSPAEARARLAEARTIAETGGRHRLLAEIARIEKELPPV